MVRHLRVSLPKQMYNLASFQLILDSFPNLQDLVLELPYYNLHLPDLLTFANLLNDCGVASSISNKSDCMYSSPASMSSDLFNKRGLDGKHTIFIHESLHQDLSNVLQMANNAGVSSVFVTKFTGCVGELEEGLKKLETFNILRLHRDDEEVVEEEVTAANHLLDLLADRDRRGRLRGVKLPKVAFTDWLPKIKPFSLGCAAQVPYLGCKARRSEEGGAASFQALVALRHRPDSTHRC